MPHSTLAENPASQVKAGKTNAKLVLLAFNMHKGLCETLPAKRNFTKKGENYHCMMHRKGFANWQFGNKFWFLLALA